MATDYLDLEFRGGALSRLKSASVRVYDEDELAANVIERARIRGETGVSTAASIMAIDAVLREKELAVTTSGAGQQSERDKLRIQIQLLQRVAKVKTSLALTGQHEKPVTSSLGGSEAARNPVPATVAFGSGLEVSLQPFQHAPSEAAVLAIEHGARPDQVNQNSGQTRGKKRKLGGVRFTEDTTVSPLSKQLDAGAGATLQTKSRENAESDGIRCPVCKREVGAMGEQQASAHVDRCLRPGRSVNSQRGDRSHNADAGLAIQTTVQDAPGASNNDIFDAEPSDDESDAERDQELSSLDVARVSVSRSSKRPSRTARGITPLPRRATGNANMEMPDGQAAVAEHIDEEVDCEDDGYEYEVRDEDEEAGTVRRSSTRGTLSRLDKSSFAVLDDWLDGIYNERVEAFEEQYGDGHGEGDVTLASGLVIPSFMASQLLPFQVEGVAWLWGLHRAGQGGILGDEMGLGKTVQMTALLGALHAAGKLRPSIIVCPATVISHWVRELTTWWPPMRVYVLHDSGRAFVGCSADAHSKALQRRAVVKAALTQGDILVTTYEALRLSSDLLLRPVWGYAILDEGHRIRNPEAGVTQAAKQLHTVHRIILSGAPIQNRLRELWSLLDFVYPGRLGSLAMFESQFTGPIASGGWTHATPLQVSTAVQCALVLRDLIGPYLLRRLKRDVASQLPTKTEQVLFCKLSPLQRALYTQFLRSQEVSDVLDGRAQAFRAVTILRKICNHPRLVEVDDFQNKDRQALGSLLDVNGEHSGKSVFWSAAEERELLGASGKAEVMAEILRLWRQEKRRCLVFAQGTRTLDLLERFVAGRGWSYLRMDGRTPVSSRQGLVDAFNTDQKWFVFLLTTRVGGVGVNLVGADRVLIFDPDWNPSTDTQARERAWRLGQRKHVTIYRLISAGTIEEKIYHRQIFKTVLTQRVLVDPRQKRLFSYADLRDLFTLTDGGEGADDTLCVGQSQSRKQQVSTLRRRAQASAVISEEDEKTGVSVANAGSQYATFDVQSSGAAYAGSSGVDGDALIVVGLLGSEVFQDPDSEPARRDGGIREMASSPQEEMFVAADNAEDVERENGPAQTTVLASLVDGGDEYSRLDAATAGLSVGEKAAISRAASRVASEALRSIQPAVPRYGEESSNSGSGAASMHRHNAGVGAESTVRPDSPSFGLPAPRPTRSLQSSSHFIQFDALFNRTCLMLDNGACGGQSTIHSMVNAHDSACTDGQLDGACAISKRRLMRAALLQGKQHVMGNSVRASDAVMQASVHGRTQRSTLSGLFFLPSAAKTGVLPEKLAQRHSVVSHRVAAMVMDAQQANKPPALPVALQQGPALVEKSKILLRITRPSEAGARLGILVDLRKEGAQASGPTSFEVASSAPAWSRSEAGMSMGSRSSLLLARMAILRSGNAVPL